MEKNKRDIIKGNLKIFLGISSGVGKTYAMISEGKQLKLGKIDVIVGFIETQKQYVEKYSLDDIEIIPELKKNHIDLNKILDRKPHLVLIDNLWHTNVPGSRHKRRYQEIVELLDNGIDVYTTLNIENIESLAPVVEGITGIKVKDTVPDSILELAKNVELIDITVDKLERRLKNFKIKTERKSFYKRSHLTALRQMALHYTSSLLKKELIEYKQQPLIKKSWKPIPSLLVSISSSPKSEYLIRWAKRTAFDQKIPWFAVYVQTHNTLDEEDNRRLQKNIKLVKELGAEIITTMDDNITRGIIRVARHHNVSYIAIGKPLPGFASRIVFKKNLVNKLIKESGEIDIFVVSEESIKARKKSIFRKPLSSDRSIKQYLLVLSALLILTISNLFLGKYISYLLKVRIPFKQLTPSDFSRFVAVV
jgi:two-component system, OmpR family, sensor histidine kinase KdpD